MEEKSKKWLQNYNSIYKSISMIAVDNYGFQEIPEPIDELQTH